MRRTDGQSTLMDASEVRRFFRDRLKDELRNTEQRREENLHKAEEDVLAKNAHKLQLES